METKEGEEKAKPLKCLSCNHLLGTVTTQELSVSLGVAIYRPTMLHCKVCGQARLWKPLKPISTPNPE